MRFRPFQFTYKAEDGETVVQMHGRGEDGRRRTIEVEGTEPAFYCEPDQADLIADDDRVVRIERRAAKCFIKGVALDRVVARFPFEVPKLRKEVSKSWEADVLYENRVRYDMGITGDVEVPDCGRVHKRQVRPSRRTANLRPGKAGVRAGGPLKAILPRWAAYDIETYDKGGFHKPEDPRAPVVSIAAWDSFSDQYVCIFNGVLRQAHRESLARKFKTEAWKVQIVEVATEEALFSTFNKWLSNVQPDILLGWNSDEYDDPYMINRARRIGAQEPDFKNLVLFDAEDGFVFSKYQRPESSALHFIATQYFDLPGKSTDRRIWDMMEKDRDELVYYNLSDVFLTKEIVLQSDILNFYYKLAERAGTGIGRCFSTGHLVDSMVFHALAGTGKAQPTKIRLSKKAKEAWGKIKGAEVFDPSSGLFDNVVEVDNSAEYPRIIRTFNISPESIIEPEDWGKFERMGIPFVETPNGNRYRLDIKGVFPALLEELGNDRDAAKAVGDQIGDDVNKKLMNTFYGVMPSPTYRMPDRRIGGDITGLSREHLKWNRDFAADWTHPAQILYGDTDSNHLHFTEQPDVVVAEQWGKQLATEMNESFMDFAQQFGPVKNCVLNVKFEHVYDKFLQAGTKKKYACLYRDENGDVERDGVCYKIKWRGFEIRRGDAAKATKETQEEVLTEMLFGADRSNISQMVHDIVRHWEAVPEKRPDEAWKLGKHKLVSKAAQVLRASQFSNVNLGTEFRRGDKAAMFYGRVQGFPTTDVFMWPWGRPLPDNASLDMKTTIDAVILSPLEGVLDLLDLRPSDCKDPVESTEDWV